MYDKIIHYDEQDVGENRRGNSIRTSNIAFFVALQSAGGRGLIVSTTHLFWHPKYEGGSYVLRTFSSFGVRYAYERARSLISILPYHLFTYSYDFFIRQAGILLREVSKFRDDIQHSDWPCVICGGQMFSD